MICTATINGILIEVSGTPEECVAFFKNIIPEPSAWWHYVNETFNAKTCGQIRFTDRFGG